MDTSTLEHIAEDYIAHRLQKGGLLVAKPKNDRLGTDLLAFNTINDGVKFCRVQVKGRSLNSSRKTNIKIPENYVSEAFILFLYLDVSEKAYESESKIYVFFPWDIENWKISPKGQYQLYISLSNYDEKLLNNRFDQVKLERIKKIIEDAEVNGEFWRISYITANQFEEGDTQSAHITVG